MRCAHRTKNAGDILEQQSNSLLYYLDGRLTLAAYVPANRQEQSEGILCGVLVVVSVNSMLLKKPSCRSIVIAMVGGYEGRDFFSFVPCFVSFAML